MSNEKQNGFICLHFFNIILYAKRIRGLGCNTEDSFTIFEQYTV